MSFTLGNRARNPTDIILSYLLLLGFLSLSIRGHEISGGVAGTVSIDTAIYVFSVDFPQSNVPCIILYPVAEIVLLYTAK